MATISETELQRRLRALERSVGGSQNIFVGDVDPSGIDYADGDTHYNSATGNLWLFSDGSWGLSATKLHIKYASTVTGIDVNGNILSHSNVSNDFNSTPYTPSGVQKAYRGLWFGGAIASTDPTDYEWTLTAGVDGYTPVKDTDYYDGGTVAQITIYKRSATALTVTDTPTGGSYAFSNHTLTPPTGWSHLPPSGSNPLYSSVTLANIVGNTGTDTTLTWSNPELFVQDGVTGTSVYTTNVYLKSSVLPGTPTGGSFEFGNNILVAPTLPTGSPSTEIWFISIPAIGSDPIYASEATFSISGDTGTDSTATWGAPRIIAQDGIQGLSGLSTYLFSVFKRSATAPTAPTGGSYNFTNNTPTAPSGWFIDPPSGNTLPTLTDPLYVSNALASTTGPTGSDSTLTWSTPTVMAKDGYSPIKGTDYGDGNNVRVEYSIDDSTWVTTQAANTVYLYIRTGVDTAGNGVFTYSPSSKFVPEHGSEYNSSYIHIKYSNNGTSFTANSGEDVGSWLGTYADQTLADSTTFSAYKWKEIVGDTPTFERYYSTLPGLLSEMGYPGDGVTTHWTQLTGTPMPAAPSTAYWIAERFTIDSVVSDWQVYPVQAKDGGIPFVTYPASGTMGYTSPGLNSTQWDLDVITAVSSFTGRTYTNHKEFGYGTVVVITYTDTVANSGDGKISGRYIYDTSTTPNSDTWVAPGSFIDGDLIVDGTIAADHIQSNTINAGKLFISSNAGVDGGITPGYLGAATTAENTTAGTTANWSTVTDDNNNMPDNNATDGMSSVERGQIFHATDTTTIDGGKIYTGSITADRISTVGLSAAQITSGTIHADRIVVGEIVSGSLTRTTSVSVAGNYNLTTSTNGQTYTTNLGTINVPQTDDLLYNSFTLFISVNHTGQVWGASGSGGDPLIELTITFVDGSTATAYLAGTLTGYLFYTSPQNNVLNQHEHDYTAVKDYTSSKVIASINLKEKTTCYYYKPTRSWAKGLIGFTRR